MTLHPSLKSLLTWLELSALADSYHLLELKPGASFAEIRASYLRLTPQYHTDIDELDVAAKTKFVALTEAYNLLMSVGQKAQTDNEESPDSSSVRQQNTEAQGQQPPATKITCKHKPNGKAESAPGKPVSCNAVSPTRSMPPLPQIELQLKWRSFQQLQQFLKSEQFPQAIALVEGLAQRLPHDLKVRQWQADAYQRWGRQLINENQFNKARVYLKKALKSDPHNRSLWSRVEKDFRRMEKML